MSEEQQKKEVQKESDKSFMPGSKDPAKQMKNDLARKKKELTPATQPPIQGAGGDGKPKISAATMPPIRPESSSSRVESHN